ncbi:MAG: SagB/ThcOx family dehydrogenase [Smithellaceae bacterium]|nr:SagB/ThcOx family dehydrogenase [Smithellaceae bacterium]
MAAFLYTVCLIFFLAAFPGISWATADDEGHRGGTVTAGTQITRENPARPALPPPAKEPKGDKMNLPKPDFKGLTLEEALAKRRSVRNYSPKPLSLAELSQLLFAAQGITLRSDGYALRAAPSAGALYPYKIYLVAGNVAAMKQGIYHYSVEDHAITLIREGDFRAELSRAALGQRAVREAAVNIILAAVPERIKVKYGERGNRYIFMEAGHISQNIYLQAASLGLGTVVIGAFNDDEANRVMQVDGRKEMVVAIQAVGQLP